jgi:ferredoxin
MHATFPDYKDFGSMICDLCQMLYEQKEIIAITDAIVGMEGDGPTAGTPRKIGALLMSANPFAADIVGETLLGFENTVPIVREAAARGLCPADISGVTLLGDDIRPLCISDFKEPETAENRATSTLSFFSSGKWGRFFMPRPKAVPDICKGCGECVASCPQHTIELIQKHGKKIAKVRHANCIRCYCCQELCPFGAIEIKKNFIIKIASRI